MREDRLYLIGRDGHVSGPGAAYEFRDDRLAIEEANRLAVRNDVEIWQGPRLVAYVVADETKQRPPGRTPDADQHK